MGPEHKPSPIKGRGTTHDGIGNFNAGTPNYHHCLLSSNLLSVLKGREECSIISLCMCTYWIIFISTLNVPICYPTNLCVHFHASCSLMSDIRQCEIMHFVSFLNDILSVLKLSFVPCTNFIHKFHQIFTLYGISILIP